jgi:hypothetical protein
VDEMHAVSPFPAAATTVHVHVAEVRTDPAAWAAAPRLGPEVLVTPAPR